MNTIAGIISVLVEVTKCASTLPFSNEEDVASNDFTNKGKLSMMETAVAFNAVELSKAAGSDEIKMNRRNYVKKIKNYNFGPTQSFEDFRKIGSQYAYAAFSTNPRILIIVSFLSQVTKLGLRPNKRNFSSYYKNVQEIHKLEST